jgi:hypothetical protein
MTVNIQRTKLETDGGWNVQAQVVMPEMFL